MGGHTLRMDALSILLYPTLYPIIIDRCTERPASLRVYISSVLSTGLAAGPHIELKRLTNLTVKSTAAFTVICVHIIKSFISRDIIYGWMVLVVPS